MEFEFISHSLAEFLGMIHVVCIAAALLWWNKYSLGKRKEGEKWVSIIYGINNLRYLQTWSIEKAAEVEVGKLECQLLFPLMLRYQDLSHAVVCCDSFLAGLSRQLPVNALAVLNVVLWH